MEPLVHLAIIWGCVYVAVFLAAKTRMTPVLYFIGLGAVMVNTGVLPHESDPFIKGFGEVGIILIMFSLGFEESSSNFVKSIKRTWGIALFGALAPFCTAYLVAQYYWNDTSVSIMCGLAMTATAVSLTMVSLRSENLHKTRAATGIMTSAVLDDIGSLAFVAVLVPIAAGEADANILGIGLMLAKALFFFAIIIVLGVWIFPHDREGWFSRIPFVGRLGIKHLIDFGDGEHATLTVLLVALLTGLLAYYFGFHPAVGAYMAGLVLREEYFHLKGTPDVDHFESTRRVIDNVAFSWIGPIFFVELGTKLIFEWDIFVSILPQTATLAIGLFIAQVTSAGIAARFTGGFTWGESVMIGFGMLGRAELAFVVMNIAFVQHSILSVEAFYTLMFTAFWLNISVPITISLWKPYIDVHMPNSAESVAKAQK